MLHSITNAINLVALMVALWLGLYLVTRSPHRPETWLAALALWAMGGYFLNQLLALNPPPTPPQATRQWLHHLILFWPQDVFELGWQGWLQGWLPAYSVVFWYHATLYMLPGTFNRRRLILASIGYACVFAGILIKARYSYHWVNLGGDPLYNSLLSIPLFPLFGAGFATFAALSTLNILKTMRALPASMPRAQFQLFALATLLGGTAVFPGIISFWLEKPVPQAITALVLLATLIMTGIGVARYNALLDHRPVQRDFLYSAAEAGAILLIYMFFHRLFMALYPLPTISYVFVGCLAVITHLLIDITRHKLDRLFLHDKNRQLRLRLRQLSKMIASKGNNEVLEKALELIGDSIPATWLFTLQYTQSGLRPVATWNWTGEPIEIIDTSLLTASLNTDELVVLHSQSLPPPFEHAVVILPLSENERDGVLLVGPSRNQTGYSEIDLLTLQNAGEVLVNLLRELHSEMPTGVLDQSYLSEQTLPRLVELGLRNLHNYAYLGDSPLTHLRLVERGLESHPPTHIERGKAVSTLLEEAVSRLRPDQDEPCGTLDRSWYPYIILRDAYLDGEPNRNIISRLYISEGTFNRTRRAAIASVARLITEMESGLD